MGLVIGEGLELYSQSESNYWHHRGFAVDDGDDLKAQFGDEKEGMETQLEVSTKTTVNDGVGPIDDLITVDVP